MVTMISCAILICVRSFFSSPADGVYPVAVEQPVRSTICGKSLFVSLLSQHDAALGKNNLLWE